MKISRLGRILIPSATVLLVLTASGCASKKYVSKKIDVVDQRLSKLQAHTDQQFAKQHNEISYLNERTATIDNKLSTVASTAEQANSTAGQALQQAQTNTTAIQAGTALIEAHTAELTNLKNNLDYTLAETVNVTFAFNKYDLTNEAKVALDSIIEKAKASPRSQIEVLGYTDDIGTAAYNLTLSRRRAEAVARYLVKNDTPLKNISLIGLGKEQTPQLLKAEVEAIDPNATKAQLRGLARRVRIRLYMPGGTSLTASAASPDTNASAQNAPVQDAPTQNATQDAPAQDQPAPDQPAQDAPAQDPPQQDPPPQK
jgi:outer membrane protein OmpA-like peptidoglycan-associated protein